MTPAINSILASPVSKTTEAPDTELGRDDFLRLLVTQLKNQDPLKPLDNAAFVAELAQFTELEQITKQVDLMEKTSRFTLLPLVGRQVRIVGNALELGAGRALINFRLEGDAQQVRVGIENSAGQVIRTLDLGAKQAGFHQVQWDGRDLNGNQMQPGTYRFQVSATDQRGTRLNVETSAVLTVSGVRVEDDGSVLLIGKQAIRPEDVLELL